MKKLTLECIRCGYKEVIIGKKVNTSDGKRCDKCDGEVIPHYEEVKKSETILECSKERRNRRK